MDFDFIIVGSGYGGILPAWRLTRAGFRVLLIERGHRWDSIDFEQSWDPIYLSKIYDFGFTTDLKCTYRVARVLGGGSVLNSMMHQKLPSEGFEFLETRHFPEPDDSKQKDPQLKNKRRAWPQAINRTVLEPYYEQVEKLMGIRYLGWDEVPRIGANFARMFRDANLSCDRAHMNLSKNDCVRSGFCEAGCKFDGKVTLLVNALSEAESTKKLVIQQDMTAVRVRAVSGAYSVDCVKTGSPLVNVTPHQTFTAPKVILAAGPLGTVPLLHRSRPYLGGKLSDALGTRACNNGDVNFVFIMPESYPDHIGYRSTNNAGTISYAFWNDYRVTMHPGFAPIAAMAGIDARIQGGLCWGLEQKHLIKETVVNRLIPVNAMRQIDHDLILGIDDKGGARITVRDEGERRKHSHNMLDLAKIVAKRCKGDVMVTGVGKHALDQGGNHILGGARMSDDPHLGVVDHTGEVHGLKGLFVTDASSIPCALGINPALTVGANALRIADGLAAGHS